jgi:Tfp pilus assembly protein PilF
MRHCISLLLALGLGLGACAHGAQPPQAGDQTQTDPQVSLLLERAHQFAEASDYTRAEQYLNLAALNGGDSAQILPLLIDVCVRDQRYRAALEYAQQHLRHHPRSYRLRYVEATLLRALGDVARSRQELERVLDASPNYADAHYSLALLLRDDLGNHLEADQHFREYLRLAPGGNHAEEAGESLLEVMP